MTSEQKALYNKAYKIAKDGSVSLDEKPTPEEAAALIMGDLQNIRFDNAPLLWSALNNWNDTNIVIDKHDKRAAMDWRGMGTSGFGLTALGGLVGNRAASLSGKNVAGGTLAGAGAGVGLALLATLVGAKLGAKGKPRTQSEQRKVNKSFPFWSHVIPGKGAYEVVRRAQFLDKKGGLFDGSTKQEAKDFYAM